MACFDSFLPTLLRFEGGFVDDPADPGGATNKGITLLTFRQAAALIGKEATLDNLKALSDADAGLLYKRLYWDCACGDGIALQALADIVVDFCVNAGCATAIRLLQQVINDTLDAAPLALDGAMGPATLQALHGADQHELYRRYRAARLAHYQDLAAERPQLQRFLAGWLHRVEAFPAA